MDDTTSPRRDWRRWALFGSLALNLLFVGLVAGAIMRGAPERFIAAPGLWHYGISLPEPYRHDLGRALRESRGEWSGPRRDLRGQRSELAAALQAEPFEIAAVEQVLERETELAGSLADRGTALLLTQIERMDASARAAYAEALMQPPRHRREDGDRR